MVRTRFAPSPTGFMHVGGLRTALFAWLVARQADGEFLLRIEDTDRQRHLEAAEKHITESLGWLGLLWDGNIYRQSENRQIYQQWAQKLLAKGRAYADLRTPDEINDLRADRQTKEKSFKFRVNRPAETPSWQSGQPLRFKSEPKDYQWHDEVMGDLKAGEEVIDDFILIKTDGYPTYDFAHIIDDHLMGISHVMRSQEFASSIPKYLNLYEALELKPPKQAMLPYVLAPNGKKKLSKRDGAKDALQYKREGVLPEALTNFLASLGRNDGTEQEIFSIEELIAKFSLERVQKSGAKFDERRLEWLNGYYIRQKPLEELYNLVDGFWPESAKNHNNDYKKQVLALVQERLKYLSELPPLTDFFFEELPIKLELIETSKQLSALGQAGQQKLLQTALERLTDSDFTAKSLSETLNMMLEETDQKPAVLFSLIRIATTWAPASPGLTDTLSLLGKDESLKRLNKAIAALN